MDYNIVLVNINKPSMDIHQKHIFFFTKIFYTFFNVHEHSVAPYAILKISQFVFLITKQIITKNTTTTKQ